MSKVTRTDADQQSESLTPLQQRTIRHARRLVANAFGVEGSAVQIGVTF